MPGHDVIGRKLLIGICRSAYGGLVGITLNRQPEVEVPWQ